MFKRRDDCFGSDNIQLESSLRAEGAEGRGTLASGDMLLKALQLRNADDLQRIQQDVANRTIVILRVTPLAQKSVEDLKTVVEKLYEFVTSIGGDIARLGEERIVITPPGVRIWRGSLCS
jgi:SepF-like predicted cell division protein (DUF552 family)